MPVLQPQQELMTIEQYEALPEDTRVEVFEGVIYDMAGPSAIHQRMLMELAVDFSNYIRKKGGSCQVFPAPFDVVLSTTPLTLVQPDLMIVCDKSKIDEKRCNGAPDFIIEITSPGNASDDYIKKAFYYRNYGVREYWIVDPKRRTVTMNYFEGDLVNVTYTFDSIIKVNIYDDLFINFAKIAESVSLYSV